jgi:hypothetical protein
MTLDVSVPGSAQQTIRHGSVTLRQGDAESEYMSRLNLEIAIASPPI